MSETFDSGEPRVLPSSAGKAIMQILPDGSLQFYNFDIAFGSHRGPVKVVMMTAIIRLLEDRLAAEVARTP